MIINFSFYNGDGVRIEGFQRRPYVQRTIVSWFIREYYLRNRIEKIRHWERGINLRKAKNVGKALRKSISESYSRCESNRNKLVLETLHPKAARKNKISPRKSH